MNIVLLAPHQDDEIISSFGLLYTLSEKHDIKVIFVTNGDYHGKEAARQRYDESIVALSQCNIPEKNVYYMGYGDTGMSQKLSFLYNLYKKKPSEVFPSGCSECTYHPSGQKTVHSLFFGEEAVYTKSNFITDLNCILSVLQPGLIILPSLYDFHGDHMATALFFNQYILPYYIGLTHYYLIHTKDDLQWPNRHAFIWSKPAEVPDLCWKNRKRIALSNEARELKKKAILCFNSQHPYAQNSFLLSFVKNEEIFFNC